MAVIIYFMAAVLRGIKIYFLKKYLVKEGGNN